jgi:hypothetical protein
MVIGSGVKQERMTQVYVTRRARGFYDSVPIAGRRIIVRVKKEFRSSVVVHGECISITTELVVSSQRRDPWVAVPNRLDS